MVDGKEQLVTASSTVTELSRVFDAARAEAEHVSKEEALRRFEEVLRMVGKC